MLRPSGQALGNARTQKTPKQKELTINITTTTRLTSALVAAAAFGSLAIGMAGTAGADPATDPGNKPDGESHFTVTNSNKLLTLVFQGYTIPPGDQGHGPALGYEIPPGQLVTFGVTKWTEGGHQTLATFKTKGALAGGKATVTMKSSNSADQAMCSADRGCTPLVITKTTQVVLF
jgi:hypothetical protein